MDEQDKKLPAPEDFLLDEPLPEEEAVGPMPELMLDVCAEEEISTEEPVILCPELPEDAPEAAVEPELPGQDIGQEEPLLMEAALPQEETVAADEPLLLDKTLSPEEVFLTEAPLNLEEFLAEDEAAAKDGDDLSLDYFYEEYPREEATAWDAPADVADPIFADVPRPEPAKPQEEKANRYHSPRKGRPKRKKGYGLFGLPHLAATVVWLAIIVMIGTSLGRMLWVCAADVLAFGRESKQVTVTITSKDTIDDIAQKLHEAELIRYPQVFKLYAKIAVDEGDILPGTFQLDTIYDYHALVVQMGPKSSTREVVDDLLIPEGLNCRQIFELLEQNNVCTVEELEAYAASGEFSDFWFLEGVERGDKYCLEGFLFPDTYDFYEYSTPREALGKMLLGFEARVDKEQTLAALDALNQRLSTMMRSKGCSEEFIAEHQLGLRELLTVASLIEEETASSTESPMIASVIFNRLTEDQVYERYLNIDAAIIYATGDANNIDTSIDHPYNTYLNAGLTPGPISNPGLESIYAALEFTDSAYYYYVLNPETGVHQFSKTLEEHEKWVEEFRNYTGGDEG
ncbi:MAG: endolytic transglycosylase MltG [Oscillospiraceae bacterium]|nr:endolytic transglycosylase MltG [Oscillospiraceae bacterium]